MRDTALIFSGQARKTFNYCTLPLIKRLNAHTSHTWQLGISGYDGVSQHRFIATTKPKSTYNEYLKHDATSQEAFTNRNRKTRKLTKLNRRSWLTDLEVPSTYATNIYIYINQNIYTITLRNRYNRPHYTFKFTSTSSKISNIYSHNQMVPCTLYVLHRIKYVCTIHLFILS